MSHELPRRTTHYTTINSDSARWDHFVGRDNDIFVCTPPRSCTTWTQTLCGLLLFDWRDFDIKPSNVSPWYEFIVHSIESVNGLLDAQDHRRLIKTHTPLDGIPYNPQSAYVTVHRDPRDVFLSVRNHMDNLQRVDFSIDPDDDISGPFRKWVRTPPIKGGSVADSMEQIILHFQSFKKFEHLANIHLFHYSDMKGNLPAAVTRMASALGIDITAEDNTQISRIAEFKNMRDNAAQFTPHANDGLWKSNEDFFKKGVGGQWRDVLNDVDLAIYDERLSTLLSADDIAWLHHGGGQ